LVVAVASVDMDDLALTGKCHLNYGVLVWEKDDINRAQDHYLEALRLFHDLNMPEDEATVYNNLAGVASYREDYDEARDFFIEALKIHDEIGNALGQALTSWNIAELLAYQGRYEEADGYVSKALTWYDESYEVWFLKAKVACHLEQGRDCIEALERTKSLAGEAWQEEHQKLWDEFTDSHE